LRHKTYSTSKPCGISRLPSALVSPASKGAFSRKSTVLSERRRSCFRISCLASGLDATGSSLCKAPGCLALAQPTSHHPPSTRTQHQIQLQLQLSLQNTRGTLGKVPNLRPASASFLSLTRQWWLPSQKEQPSPQPAAFRGLAFHLPSTYPDRPLRVTEYRQHLLPPPQLGN
jgi:hypothetical protein